jgi:peptidoglycan/xylan/chitin deacetylase (PgdA/CDA1 family)
MNLFGGGHGDTLLRRLVGRPWLGTVNVVYYHYVGDPAPHYSAFHRGCTIEKFSNDLRSLGQIFDFVSLGEVLAGDLAQGQHRRPTLAITFDDGFDLRKEGAMEVLDRFGVKATTFVITATVGNQMLMWRNMLSAIQAMAPELVWRRQYLELAATHGLSPLGEGQTLLEATCQWDMKRKDEWAAELWKRCNLPPVEQYLAEKRPYFDWAGLQEWLAAGHSVGFHTHSHPFCSRLSLGDLETELVRPAVQLKQRLGLDDLCLSYPFGHRLKSAIEDQLFEKGLFSALFGTRGFSRRGASNARLERLALEGCRVGRRLILERLWAIRRRLLKR